MQLVDFLVLQTLFSREALSCLHNLVGFVIFYLPAPHRRLRGGSRSSTMTNWAPGCCQQKEALAAAGYGGSKQRKSMRIPILFAWTLCIRSLRNGLIIEKIRTFPRWARCSSHLPRLSDLPQHSLIIIIRFPPLCCVLICCPCLFIFG
ncbi:uncharacterized protein BO66DRAFT_87777 [Aspergillus aculeatinus CBS 121060]|uniref:Uncharacterized protein n=1 Tax=Aspergillus aculeatinus CBS 121060 TaxID=1448322 RepID=A0ACD1H953_9EURO|nr:hypothetical protein BO66DRAFT_87777 [Aspergillus aculeatinus CBS 121060]RAH70092.1 hypothetical protein BO66DRAFT_87777 [Aspergillus aculeatinus CBS 121060]